MRGPDTCGPDTCGPDTPATGVEHAGGMRPKGGGPASGQPSSSAPSLPSPLPCPASPESPELRALRVAQAAEGCAGDAQAACADDGLDPCPLAVALADSVRRWLAGGLVLDADARVFLEAQTGLPWADAVRLLAAPGGEAGVHGAADALTVLEYLLYPDMTLRTEVERLLASVPALPPVPTATPIPPHTLIHNPASAPETRATPDAAADTHAIRRLPREVLRALGHDLGAVLHASAPGNPASGTVAGAGVFPLSDALMPDAPLPPSGMFVLSVPEWAAALLVRRLRLDVTIPEDMARVASAVLPETRAMRVRLALRDARFDLAGARADHVLRFLRRMPPDDPAYDEALSVWLDLLHDTPQGRSVHAALSARRERLARAAREAEDFAFRLGRLNMEVLMLQGVTAPALGADEARRRVRLLDRMCLAVLGRAAADDPAQAGTPSAVRDLGAFDVTTGLDDLLRLLS